MDILLYVTWRHYRHYLTLPRVALQHYRYIINDTLRIPQFRRHPTRIPRNEFPRILVFTNSPHPIPRILHDPGHVVARGNQILGLMKHVI